MIEIIKKNGRNFTALSKRKSQTNKDAFVTQVRKSTLSLLKRSRG